MATVQETESTEKAKQTSDRPTGIGPSIAGWVFLLFTFLVLILSLGAKSPEIALMLQIIAGAFFSLFLVFWSVGYIVNAISYLPGRD